MYLYNDNNTFIYLIKNEDIVDHEKIEINIIINIIHEQHIYLCTYIQQR